MSHSSDEPVDFDVVVIGAGISGISAAYHLQQMCSDHTFAILERRAELGGTWDLFRYPGIRSDSDMHTLGFRFQPWTRKNSIADGDEILEYLHETVEAHDIRRHIQFGVSVRAASWSHSENRWTLRVEDESGEPSRTVTCRFVWSCAGYYDYDQGHAPDFAGSQDFTGTIVHPQHWPQDLDYTGKRVVVIGSGATAVTLLPSLAERAQHVTMLQRSPSYVVSLPRQDPLSKRLRGRVPGKLFHRALRWKSIAHSRFLFWFARRYPDKARAEIMKGVREQLGSEFDAERHFTPAYNPWDQRVCMTPDDAFFDALKGGKASVVTDHIKLITATGIQLESGESLDTDIIVTATGLKLQILGGLELSVDGRIINPHDHTAYKGMMCSDIPNLAMSVGYTNASWTLKADLTSEYVCRLLRHCRDDGHSYCCPRLPSRELAETPLLDFTSGYVLRSLHLLPKQGAEAPWKLYQNYFLDLLSLRHGSLRDEAMEFGGRATGRN